MKKIRLLVADDHAVVRMGLVALLDSERDIEIVGEAGNGEEAVAIACATRPDVILMDIVMPVKNGVEATMEIHRDVPSARILILTTFSDADDIANALAAGASGALLKNSDYADVISAIRRVATGERSLAPEVQKMLDERLPLPQLTDRQSEILASMARGLTNADIAKQFGITPDGVKFHITSILSKLEASNRAEAIAIALRKHLL